MPPASSALAAAAAAAAVGFHHSAPYASDIGVALRSYQDYDRLDWPRPNSVMLTSDFMDCAQISDDTVGQL